MAVLLTVPRLHRLILAAVFAVGFPVSAQEVELSKPPKHKPPTRTDRYGDPLPKGAIMRIGTLRFCQPWPSRLVFSPDGKFLASGGADKRIRLWDPDTGKELRTLEGHKDQINWIDLSADGKWLASGSQNGELFLWEVDTGKVRQRFRGHGGPNYILSLSPNGKYLASISLAKTTGKLERRLWDADTGKEIRSLPVEGGGRVEAMKFTPDSKYFAFLTNQDQGVQLMDVATANVIRTFKAHPGRIGGFTFTADGATLLSGHSDGYIRAWDMASGKEKGRYDDGIKWKDISCLALSLDEKVLAYRDGQMIHIWDLARNKDLVPPWNSSPEGVTSIAYSPDGKKVAVGGRRIAILDTATGKRLNPAPASESPIWQIMHSPDGKLLAVWRWWGDQMIEIWDTTQGRRVATLRPKWWKEGISMPNGGRFSAMSFSPDGKQLTTVEGHAARGKVQNIICHWQPHTGSRQKEISHEGAWLDTLSYSGGGETLACLDGGPRQGVILWNAATGQERGRITLSDHTLGRIAGTPQLSPVGRLLACRTSEKTVVLWDTKTGKQIRHFGPRSVGSSDTLVYSPDGRNIATPGQGMGGNLSIHSDVVLWETATGKERLRIIRNEGQLHQIAFSPNGRFLAAIDRTETIHFWDSWTGREIDQFTGHRGVVTSLSFAPDGKTLASGGADNTILIWDMSGILPATQPASEKLSRAELARCWDDLAGTDAARAYATITELARHPDQAVSLLKAKLASYPKMDAQPLARLIADLDSDDFKTRENASKELAKLGRMTEGALKKTLDENPSAELKRRIQILLDKLDPKEDDPEQILLLRVIEVLERLGTPEARKLLRKLAQEASIPDVAREAQGSLQRLGKVGKEVP